MTSKETVTPSTGTNSAAELLTGRVKWFNNKAGYGFITVTDGNRSGSDIFVHHSAIGVSDQQYKYLVQGEYVDFKLTETPGGAHAFQAANICGIRGGKLMCETRRDFKLTRSNYKTPNAEVSVKETPPKLTRTDSISISSKPKVSRDTEKKEWTVVGENKPPVARGRGRPPRSAQKESN